MDVDDLSYLLNNNPYKTKNYYKNVSSINASIQERYLKSSMFNYKTVKGDMRVRDKFKIFDLNNREMFELKELKYPSNGTHVRSFVENKLKTENYLSKFGINTPQSRVYHMNEENIAKNECFENTDRVVIKPLVSSRGRGVQVGVTEDRFDINWEITKKALRKNNEKMIVQNVVEGFEARATIIEGNLLSIIARVPPFVTGNGKNSISELLEMKNNERKKCDFRKKMLIKETATMKEFLASNNMDFNFIPQENEKILLNSVSNIAYGGETINVTNMVCKEVKEEAMNAMACIPNLNTCGIDIMMTSFGDIDPIILEINAYPFLSIPYLPTYGEGSNPTKLYVEAMISQYQSINQPFKRYYIEDHVKYISSYFKLNKRREKMINKLYKNVVEV